MATLRTYQTYLGLAFLAYITFMLLFHIQLNLHSGSDLKSSSDGYFLSGFGKSTSVSGLADFQKKLLAVALERRYNFSFEAEVLDSKATLGDLIQLSDGRRDTRPCDDEQSLSCITSKNRLTEKKFDGSNRKQAHNESDSMGRRFQEDDVNHSSVDSEGRSSQCRDARGRDAPGEESGFQPLPGGHHVYSAYYDDRLPRKYIRIMALLQVADRPHFFCHFPSIFQATADASSGRHKRKDINHLYDRQQLRKSNPVGIINEESGIENNGVLNVKQFRKRVINSSEPERDLHKENIHDQSKIDDSNNSQFSDSLNGLQKNNAGDITKLRGFNKSKSVTSDRNYITVKAELYEMCENHNMDYGGWIISCEIPPEVAALYSTSRFCDVLLTFNQSQLVDGANITRIPLFPLNHTFREAVSLNESINRTEKGIRASKFSTEHFVNKNIRDAEPPSNTNTLSETHSVLNSTNIKSNDSTLVDFRFAICVPPLFGHVPSTTLVEFIELNRILGVSHIFFYKHEVPGEVSRTLEYYTQTGYITVIPWQLPVETKYVWYRAQLIAINDCLYRSMRSFHYVAFHDVDEFIIPHIHSTWKAMISHVLSPSFKSTTRHPVAMKRSGFFFRFKNVPSETSSEIESSRDPSGFIFLSAFFDPLLSAGATGGHVMFDIESDLRTKSFSSVRTKVLVKPRDIFELGIHHISRILEPTGAVIRSVPSQVAFLHHYRKCLTEFDAKMNCQIFTRDDSLSRFIPSLRHSVHVMLWRLKEVEQLRQQKG